MYWGVYAFLGTIALLTSYAAITRRVDPRLGAPPAAVLWWVWAFASFNVTFRGPSNVVHDSYSSLAIIGMAAGVIMLVFAAAAVLGRLAPLAETRYARTFGRDVGRGGVERRRPTAARDRAADPDVAGDEDDAGRRTRSPFAPTD